MDYQQNPVGVQFRKIFLSGNVLSRLILINSAIWLAVYLVRIPAFLMQQPGNSPEELWLSRIITWLAVPASAEAILHAPWTVITYMFFHIQFWHLFFNMLWLYWFGKIFLEFLSQRQLLMIYLIGGLAGAMVFVLAFNIFPAFQSGINQAVALGASASVLAITVATAIMVPDYTLRLLFIGPVKLKHIALTVIAIDILMIRSSNAGGHFAHLGGALAGLVWASAVRHGFFNALHRWIRKLKNAGFGFRKRKPLKKVYSRRPLTDEEYNTKRAERQKQIDHILDKIAKSGYQSLSDAEKELLFSESKRN